VKSALILAALPLAAGAGFIPALAARRFPFQVRLIVFRRADFKDV
jgi:hypothetical protein